MALKRIGLKLLTYQNVDLLLISPGDTVEFAIEPNGLEHGLLVDPAKITAMLPSCPYELCDTTKLYVKLILIPERYQAFDLTKPMIISGDVKSIDIASVQRMTIKGVDIFASITVTIGFVRSIKTLSDSKQIPAYLCNATGYVMTVKDF